MFFFSYFFSKRTPNLTEKPSPTMYLKLSHQNLDVYQVLHTLVLDCYRASSKLPSHERYGMVQQLRRASVSALLNLAEGASRLSSTERKRFYEIARGSVVEIDACLEVAVNLDYLKTTETDSLGNVIVRSFQLLSKMMNNP